MARTFGIEIEGYNVPAAALAAAITAAGVRCHDQRYGHDVPTVWKVVTDASVRGLNGFEVVSPILSGEAGLATVRVVMDAIKNAGGKVNKTCGLHVHVGADDLTVREFRNIAKNYLVFEDFFDVIMPVSRRANNNQYIRSLRSRFGDYSHASAARGMAALTDCATIDSVIECVNGRRADSSSRYHKLNLTAFWRQRTIEFRQHSGTTDADKACNWIVLLLAFVEKSAVSKPRPRAAGTLAIAPSVLFTQFFLACGITAPAVRAHFTARRRAFADGTTEA